MRFMFHVEHFGNFAARSRAYQHRFHILSASASCFGLLAVCAFPRMCSTRNVFTFFLLLNQATWSRVVTYIAQVVLDLIEVFHVEHCSDSFRLAVREGDFGDLNCVP